MPERIALATLGCLLSLLLVNEGEFKRNEEDVVGAPGSDDLRIEENL